MNFKEIFRNLISQLYPELPARTHVPLRGKVTAVHGDAGDVQPTSGPRRYSVDVQPILPDGSNDPERDVLLDVSLPVQWAGHNRGIFCLPDIGAVCLVGFVDGNAAFPYVHSFLPDGFYLPSVSPGDCIILWSGGEIKLKEGNPGLSITISGMAEITANTVLVNSGDIQLGGPEGKQLACLGDVVVSGLTPIGVIAPRETIPTNGSQTVRAI
ncbi:phage baseplate assembly protein V [Deinococcus cellulosilyticus]|uniref:Gp5/Type VI secretion system Vgr protein OB-fold domain-containing protein n=1 Tax=Deinococcus cellulosilyticus (strain DSM 18568 / NBRC 106333 / KACC 11606 / 5516J-15) TaxID=1223518 RepID=A0A511MXF9_DEIC1|nr:phage baseplate assembly protein V [Deinococcus cellulosilyticus]GEM44837.1 hypothetical protein DC3_04720 [Deinococcus cellulosilyticus NBRC 106333 = KACC 11606]